MSWLVLSSSYPESRTFSVPCSASEQVHRKPEGRMARTGDNWTKGYSTPHNVRGSGIGEVGQEQLITAQGVSSAQWVVSSFIVHHLILLGYILLLLLLFFIIIIIITTTTTVSVTISTTTTIIFILILVYLNY